MEIILAPPIALVLYALLVGLLSVLGRRLAASGNASLMKSSTYAGGEAPPTSAAMPGYSTFFVIALFFAVLHLGVLMLASAGLSLVAGIYVAGLLLVLLVLTLG